VSRILLIDADVLAYKCAAAAEKATNWGDGYWTWHCDENEVKESILNEIDNIMDKLLGDTFKLCLTDSDTNFRKTVLPTYKGKRANVKKPLVLRSIREWLIEEHKAYLKPRLEGDDVMGILSTWSGLKGEKIIVSIDKDMKTIPGLYVRDPMKDDIIEVTGADANYWHLFQTLTGDVTDGYSGCPNVGQKKAEAILADDPSWDAVLAAFTKAGLSEHEALIQARVARILRASDYDFKRKEPILWSPTS